MTGRCDCGDSECRSCGTAQGTRLYTGGYACQCETCRTPLLMDEEDRGTCDDCAAKRAYHERMHDALTEDGDE